MPTQPIRLFGDPVLRRPAVEVVDFDRELRKLVEDLTDTMREAPGSGLAAPQIGVGLRVFTWWVDGELGHLVNPVLDLSEEERSLYDAVRAAGLDEATARLDALVATPSDTVDVAAWETTNLLTISAALADAATRREETRGSHWREDHPERDDADWAGHLDVVMRDGVGSVEFHPEPASDALVAAGVDPEHIYEDSASGRLAKRPGLDACLKALRRDDTLVIWGGEFGRTPRINKKGGRDHWGNSLFCLLAGGGIRGGQGIGSTNAKGERPLSRAVKPCNLHATIYKALGMDPTLHLIDHQGRPTPVLEDPTPIHELF